MKNWMRYVLSTIGILLTVVGVVLKTNAGEIKLAWDANTEQDLAGYKVYRSSYEDMSIPVVMNVPLDSLVNSASPQFTNSGLENGTYYYQVTAYNYSGGESGFSNKIVVVLNVPPADPRNLRQE